ncbi:hypothetical protein HDV00_004017 [Rhizophlyctis rosea]|nr:hypothetical protein HDV00_004017 [Rhizophlyctis rosea]
MTGEEIHILVVGGGAVGAFYGSRMHQPSQNVHVSVVCRSNYSAVASTGFIMNTVDWGKYVFTPHRVFSTVEDASKSGITWNHVVVTTKVLPQVYDIGELIAPTVTEGVTSVHLFQNGIGFEESVCKRFPVGVEISSCVLYIGVSQSSPAEIQHAGLKIVELGPYLGPDQPPSSTPPKFTPTPKFSSFVSICQKGGLDAKIHPDIQMARWMKAMWNATFAMVGVLSGCVTSGEILQDPDACELVRKLMIETQRVAEAVLGRPFPADWEGVEGLFVKTQKIGFYKASIILDWEAGRETELEVLLGNIVRMGKKIGKEATLLESIYVMLRLADRKRLQKQIS